MATILMKNLGQVKPSALTDTDLVPVVPVGHTYTIISIVVCNTGVGTPTIRIYNVLNGYSAGVNNALVYDLQLLSKESKSFDLKVGMALNDKIVVYSSDGNVTFHAYGLDRY